MFLSNKWKAGNKPNFSKINTHYKRNVTRSSITAHDGWITKAEYSKAVDGLTTITTLHGHTSSLVDLAINEERFHLITLGADKVVNVWDIRNY